MSNLQHLFLQTTANTGPGMEADSVINPDGSVNKVESAYSSPYKSTNPSAVSDYENVVYRTSNSSPYGGSKFQHIYGSAKAYLKPTPSDDGSNNSGTNYSPYASSQATNSYYAGSNGYGSASYVSSLPAFANPSFNSPTEPSNIESSAAPTTASNYGSYNGSPAYMSNTGSSVPPVSYSSYQSAPPIRYYNMRYR